MANPALRMLRTEEVSMPEGRHLSRPIRSSHDTIRISRVDRHMSRVTAWHVGPLSEEAGRAFLRSRSVLRSCSETSIHSCYSYQSRRRLPTSYGDVSSDHQRTNHDSPEDSRAVRYSRRRCVGVCQGSGRNLAGVKGEPARCGGRARSPQGHRGCRGHYRGGYLPLGPRGPGRAMDRSQKDPKDPK